MVLGSTAACQCGSLVIGLAARPLTTLSTLSWVVLLYARHPCARIASVLRLTFGLSGPRPPGVGPLW